MRSILYILVGVLMCGCASMTSRESSLQSLTPLPQYRQWFHEVEQCSGLRGNFDEIEWIEVRHRKTLWLGWMRIDGGVPARNRIFIRAPYALSERLIKHEMLHILEWGRWPLLPPWIHGTRFKKCNL